MSVQFQSPNFRSQQSDLTINISPLGLVELSDEEFEVHGPRLNRYANNWAWYLGHHWGHRRAEGDHHMQFNYCRQFSDYITNFCFGRGIRNRVPRMNEAVVPALLHRVWEVDNDKKTVLWEFGNMGSVTGDGFLKVAYEEPWTDSMGVRHAGKVRLIPLNSSHCFPEWHPHDRDRMVRLKIKYRFWGTAAEGTRQVFTWTEIIDENEIQEYVNDERIDVRPNPIGAVPVVHAANMPVSGSPWGLSDITDVIPLNRQFNETAEMIQDIINYHAEPVTIVTGAKADQMERGANKMWHGLPSDAKVFNLELGSNLGAPTGFLDLLKRSMHEMTGVPEMALGQFQPISNTSGVALQIAFQPLMNRRNLKATQYGKAIKQVNELILRTLAVKEPWAFQYDPLTNPELKDGQLPVLDPTDPLVYQTEVDFPDPLPLDQLIKLNEMQAKITMGLESKRGALRELGEEFPDSKIAEIMEERKSDLFEEGSLNMLRAHLEQAIMTSVGGLPVEMGADPNQTVGGGEEGPGGPQEQNGGRPVINPLTQNLAELMEGAYATHWNSLRSNPEQAGASGES